MHGLMGRVDYSGKDCALFVFERPRLANMWMRNTYMDLQVVFCSNGRVIKTQHIRKLSDDKAICDKLCDLVIETRCCSDIPVGAHVHIQDGLVSIVSSKRID